MTPGQHCQLQLEKASEENSRETLQVMTSHAWEVESAFAAK